MKCEEVEAIVFSDRKATEEEMNAAWEHAEHCPACRALLNEANVLSGAREMDEEVQVPADFTAGWQAQIRTKAQQESLIRKMRRTFSGGGWMRAAAYAMCAVVFFGAGTMMNGGRINAGAKGHQEIYDDVYVSEPVSEPQNNRMLNSRAMPEAGLGAEDESRILYTAWMDLTTGALDETVEAIKQQVQEAGGSVLRCEVRTDENSEKYADMELTIPSGDLDSLLEAFRKLGRVERESVSSQNVTEMYKDNASRLDSARARKNRLDELYAQAQDMDDIIALNDALFEAQAEIDALSGQQVSIDERAKNARLTVDIRQEETETGFFSGIVQSVEDGIIALGVWMERAVRTAAYALPWLAVLAAAAFVVKGIVRKIRGK